MEPRPVLGGLLAAVALALAACGGSSSSSPLSKQQLAAKVNAVCASYHNASAVIPQPANLASNPAATAAYLDKLKPLVESEHRSIEQLRAAPEVRAQFEQFRAASTHQLGLFESALAKAHAKDPSGLRDIVSAARYKQAVMVPLERTLGFTACE